jgi:Zn-finger nucleic acid-binding protein
MVVIGRPQYKLCSNCYPRATKMEQMNKLEVFICPVCQGTDWYNSGEVPVGGAQQQTEEESYF